MIDENCHSDHSDLEHPLSPTKNDRKLRQLCSVNNYISPVFVGGQWEVCFSLLSHAVACRYGARPSADEVGVEVIFVQMGFLWVLWVLDMYSKWREDSSFPRGALKITPRIYTSWHLLHMSVVHLEVRTGTASVFLVLVGGEIFNADHCSKQLRVYCQWASGGWLPSMV